MWQRVLVNRQISSLITSRASRKCTKALFSTRKTNVSSRSQNTQQNSFTAFPEAINNHKININTQKTDLDSQFMRSSNNNSNKNQNNYSRIESANLLEDLNKRNNSTGLSNLLAALGGQFLLWWLLKLLDDGV